MTYRNNFGQLRNCGSEHKFNFPLKFSDAADNKSSKSEQSTGRTSTISMDSMRSIINRLRLGQFRDITRKNYHAIWTIFNKFTMRLDVQPECWEEKLIHFVGYLVEQNKQSSTIKSYV